MTNDISREIVTKQKLYERLENAIRQSEVILIKEEARLDVLRATKRNLDEYFEDELLRKTKETAIDEAILMDFVGQKVFVYFKDGERGIYGLLEYVDEFSPARNCRKPNYFYIGNTSFKANQVWRVEIK